MYMCILNQAGGIVLHRNMKAEPEAFLQAIAAFRQDIVVAVECIFTWYWLADLCRPADCTEQRVYHSAEYEYGHRAGRVETPAPAGGARAASFH